MVEETTFEKLEKALLELLRGYPDYVFYGKIEYFLDAGETSVEILKRHKIIEKIPREEVEYYIEKMPLEERQRILLLPERDRFRWYRLNARGVDLAISMINLKYSKKVHNFTIIIILLASGNLALILTQLLIMLFNLAV